ncbi:MAG: 30S ribosomal protein S4 [Nanoarchaeota archaeon]|nr:30S ribosomal protein S4 [Nanoarchaeota archaeon]
MRKIRRSFDKPLRPWDKDTIDKNKTIKKEFGLRRKKEILRAETIIRNYRRLARGLAANKDENKELILLTKLRKIGLIDSTASLDDVLVLTTGDILNRRLQTIIQKKGLARTVKQARQFIVHGHISVDGRKSKWPSMLIPIDKEASITFSERSKVKENVLKKLEEPIKEKAKSKEEPKVEEKKVEETTTEEPKVEEVIVEESKVEEVVKEVEIEEVVEDDGKK